MPSPNVIAITLATTCCMNYTSTIGVLSRSLNKVLRKLFSESAETVGRRAGSMESATTRATRSAGSHGSSILPAVQRSLVNMAVREGVQGWHRLAGDAQILQYKIMPAPEYSDKPTEVWPVAETVDWRYADQPIRFQSQSEMTVPYAVVAAMENYIYRDRAMRLKLSEYKLYSASRSLDIGSNIAAAHQEGVWLSQIQYVNGIKLDEDHPYRIKARAEPLVRDLVDNAAIVDEVNARKAVVLILEIDDTFRLNGGELISSIGYANRKNHAVSVVGYHLDRARPDQSYYIVRNHWGHEWGDKGYGKLAMGYCRQAKCAAFALDKVTVEETGQIGSAKSKASYSK
ncbi:MAG: hypothetical protein FJ146_19315 [Deltaproteobacteria bacterium]|nr:hypothetical protein [Deltaproteobacteria bacterium]